jgi:cytidylate kinase
MAIITISRGSFAGGKAVAEALGRRYGKPALSREEVLGEAAREYGISEVELTSTLNEAPPFWQQVPGKRLAYVKCVTAVLLAHAEQGHLVYHGHVGHLLLAGLPQVLRVRVIADLEFRIRAAMEQARQGREEALAYIQRVDRERSRWAKLLYGVDWDDPAQYDVLLNLGRVSADSAADTIVRLAEMPEFQPTAESRKRFDDFQLSCRVWGALARNPETRNAGIHVAADGGDVVISGTVGSARTTDTITQVARSVEGVRNLRCEAGAGTDWFW